MKKTIAKILGLVSENKLDEATAEMQTILDEPDPQPEPDPPPMGDPQPQPAAITTATIEPPKGSTGTPAKPLHEYSYKELLAVYNSNPTDFEALKGAI